MQAGRLRHVVTVQRLVAESPQQTPEGEPETSWGTYCTVYAEIAPNVGREFFAAAQQQAEVDTKIRMRYETGVNDQITAAMRVLHPTTCPCGVPAEQIYAIKAPPINVEMRNREIVLMCGLGVVEG